MSQAAVVFDHVWKKFRRGERHDSLRDLIPGIARGLFRRGRGDELEADREFWALQDVSFEVHPGHALGIIGPNGAGKSTTLKLLTKILRPTRGSCHVRGRIGALIEVAAGFHPDLTGRENIFLQGAIMGMTKGDVTRRLDEIIEFAGVADFVDTPVKRYSSGMNARLGFSIAAHLNPEVLIVDEVLSVGDNVFQARCVERMHAFRREGVTIVFVSHNLQAVAALCDTTLFVKRSVQAIGPTDEVLMKYVAASSETASTADAVAIVGSEFVGRGTSVTVAPAESLTLRVSYRAKQTVKDVVFGFVLHRSTDSMIVYDTSVPDHDLGVTSLEAGEEVSIDYTFNANLVRGQYHLHLHVLHHPTQVFLGRLNPAGMISVVENHSVAGIADLQLSPAITRANRPLAATGVGGVR